MEGKEIILEMEMDYEQLVQYLLNKYGAAKYDYFRQCTTGIMKNKKVTRTSEGLFCHHIDEDKGCNLSDKGFALAQPFSYQKKERLVYCNLIEHLLLHIQIGKDKYWEKNEKLEDARKFTWFITPGVKFISAQINDLYRNNGSDVAWENRCFEEIKDNFEEYIYILKSFVQYINTQFESDNFEERLCLGEKVFHKEFGGGRIVIINEEEERTYTVEFSMCEKTGTFAEIAMWEYECFLHVLKRELSCSENGKYYRRIYDSL